MKYEELNMADIPFAEFDTFLRDVLKEKFPDTELFIAEGGDYLKDTVMELRQYNARYRYSPWELYKKNSNYECTTEELVVTWEQIVNKQGL